MPHPHSPLDQSEGFGPFSSFENFVSPKTARAGRDETRAVAARGALGRFRQAVLDKQSNGLDLGAALERTLADPTHQEVLTQPDFPKSAQEFIDLLTPAQDEFMTVAPGASVASKTTGKLGAQAPGAPTAAEKLVEAILAAPEGSEERKLLERGLAGTGGVLGVKDYLTLVAAGAKPHPDLIPKAITTPVTPERAANILALGTASGPRAPNGIDMFAAALGIDVPGSPLNGTPIEDAQSMMLIKEELAKQKGSTEPLLQILAAMGGGGGAADALGGLGESDGGLTELFEKFNKGSSAQAPGVEARPGEVPIFGAGPQVGGQGGQAPGPRGATELRPDQIKAIEAMPVEDFAQLSAETLKQITEAVLAKPPTITLSDEQKRALIAANGARLGRTN